MNKPNKLKLTKREQTKGISWEACVAFGVRPTAYNRARFENGEALDLIADTCTEDSLNLESDPDWIKQQADYFECNQ